MPTLPDRYDVGVQQLRPAMGVVQPARPLAAEALEGVASNAMQVLQQEQDRREQFKLGLAETKLKIAREEVLSQIEQEPYDPNDPDKIDRLYKERIKPVYDEVSKSVTTQHGREALGLTWQGIEAEGRFRAGDLARGKEKSHFRGELDTTLEALKRRGMTSPDQVGFVHDGHALIDEAIGAGYLTPEEGAVEKRRFAEGTAQGALEVMDPQQRHAVLTGPGIADMLPPDVRAKMLKATENELYDVNAMAIADSIPEGTSYTEAMEIIKSKTDDPRQLRYAREEWNMRRAAKDYDERKYAEAMTESINVAAYDAPVGARWEDVLGEDQQRFLKENDGIGGWNATMARRAQGIDSTTDFQFVNDTRDLIIQAANGDKAAQQKLAKVDIGAKVGVLSTEDAASLTDMRAKVLSGDADAKGDVSTQANELKTYGHGPLGLLSSQRGNPEKRAAFDAAYYAAARAARAAKPPGAKLTSDERVAIIKSLTLQTYEGGWFEKDKRAYEQINEDAIDPVLLEDYRRQGREELGREPTAEEVMAVYRAKHG